MADKSEQAGESAGAGTDASPGDIVASDERTGTLIFSGILTLFGLFWIWAASDLPSRLQTAYLTQGFLPTTAGVLLAVLGAMLFVATWRTASRPPEELGRERLFEPSEQIRGAAVFGALFVYILILPHVHYLISTFLLMTVGLYLAREPLRPRLFVLAAAMSLLFFAIFVWGLQVALPGSQYG